MDARPEHIPNKAAVTNARRATIRLRRDPEVPSGSNSVYKAS